MAVYTAALVATVSMSANALNNGLDLTPAMGFNTWEKWECDISEGLIHKTAEAMVSKGLRDAGYTYLNLDDCWMAKERNATGHLTPSSNFTSGMHALGEFIHSKGLKYGIYQSAGTKTCQGLAGSLGNEWIDAQTFASWGVDFLKYDDCYHELFKEVEKDAPHRFPFDEPPILRYPLMGQALNRTGRVMSYMCNFPWQLWDMEKDQAYGGMWTAEFCNSWRTCGDPGPGFSSAMGYVDCAEKWAGDIPSGPGRWNNLDAMEIGNGQMTEEEERVVFSLYALIKTPLFIGSDVVTLEGHSLATYLNKEVIAINQDPLGAPGRRMRGADDPTGLGELWVGILAQGHFAAVLVNRGEKACNVTVTWSDLNQAFSKVSHLHSHLRPESGSGVTHWVSESQTMSARDLWEHKELGKFTGQFTAENVSPHSGVAVTLVPAPGVLS